MPDQVIFGISYVKGIAGKYNALWPVEPGLREGAAGFASFSGPNHLSYLAAQIHLQQAVMS